MCNIWNLYATKMGYASTSNYQTIASHKYFTLHNEISMESEKYIGFLSTLLRLHLFAQSKAVN